MYKCLTCKKSFDRKFSLERHLEKKNKCTSNKEKNDESQEEISKLKKEYNQIKDEYDKYKLHQENDKLKEVNNKLEEENNKLKEENNKLKEENNKLVEDNTRLNKECDDLKEKNNNIKEKNYVKLERDYQKMKNTFKEQNIMIYKIIKNNMDLDLDLDLDKIEEDNLNAKDIKRITIPKPMRIAIWNNYFGENVGKANCPCCNREKITQLNFECGHIIAKAKGGSDALDNFIPVCKICNGAMQTINFWDFHKKINLKMYEKTNNNFNDSESNNGVNNINNNSDSNSENSDSENSDSENSYSEDNLINNKKTMFLKLNVIKKSINDTKNDLYNEFLNEKTQKSCNHIHTTKLYSTFVEWFENKYPNQFIPSNRKFILNIKKYHVIHKSVQFNDKISCGIKNLELK